MAGAAEGRGERHGDGRNRNGRADGGRGGTGGMVALIHTVVFIGVEARPVEVQVHLANGLPAFQIVGLPDKAVAESRERVRAALSAIGLALPPKRITVNLAPADLPKEGSHYDLPIALGLLAAADVLEQEGLLDLVALGELSLDGRIQPVPGVLPAAMAAVRHDRAIACPATQGAEARWAGAPLEVLAADHLLALVQHLKGQTRLPAPPRRGGLAEDGPLPDLADVRGQESARRALEVAAAGGHNLLLVGPPGAGKSMLAERLISILPPLSPEEALEVSLVHSVAGLIGDGRLAARRPFRNPHHSASMPALIGGGARAKPGEVSLAHRGVLFLDELPEFSRAALEALRQPLESGEAVVARAAAHVSYPARFQLVAAMNPCRCGHLADPTRACSRAPRCAIDYQARISGPLLDRIDLHVEVGEVSARELMAPAAGEASAIVAERVAAARRLARERARRHGVAASVNAELSGATLERLAAPDEAGRALLMQAMERLKLSARGYHRVLRVARSIADLRGGGAVTRGDIAEALAYRGVAIA